MKKVLVILCVGFALLVSCSKENDVTEEIETVDPITNKQSTGSSANDLLSDKKFKSMVIEVVYVAGFQPTSIAINNFVAFLEARTHKPNGINIVLRSIPSPGTSPYTNEEIVAIEETNRTKYNTSNEIAVWAFFADGESARNTSSGVVLGTAYRNTSFVIYEQTIHGLSNSTFKPSRSVLETTVITHEFGHIFGLTNLGTALQSNHEDGEHPKHCNIKTCLMFWSAETGSGIGEMVSGGTAPQLDAQCIADLRANGGK